MTRRHVTLVASASLLLGVFGCLKLTENQNANLIALVQLNARSQGSGYTTAPIANFYRAGTVTLSSASQATDTCQVGVYDASATNTTDATVISGGASVSVTVSGNTGSMLRSDFSVAGTYRLGTLSGLAFTPGDSASFTISGDASGFPATSGIVKTAEAFTMSTIALPAAGQPIAVTWTPAATGAAMLISLLYNDGSNSTPNVPNRQVFCALVDDGAASIPANVVDAWRLGSAAARSVVVRRLRTLIKQPAGTTAFLNVISLFELPVPVSP